MMPDPRCGRSSARAVPGQCNYVDKRAQPMSSQWTAPRDSPTLVHSPTLPTTRSDQALRALFNNPQGPTATKHD
jgi:hypothetical protein